MNDKYKPCLNSPIEAKIAYLVEETGEMLAALGKSDRFGFSSSNPELPPEQRETNAEWLLREIGDVEYAMFLIKEELKLI